MTFTNNNLKFCVGLTLHDYEQWRDPHSEDGFRTHWLSLAGTASDNSSL